MKIVIETIPHLDQRYKTCGDWFYEGEDLHIKVSDLKDWKKEATIAVHELVEAILCKQQCIYEEEVTQFDMEFEARRTNDDEPGDDIKAPYRKQHCIATGVERMLVASLDMSWKEYEDAIRTLDV